MNWSEFENDMKGRVDAHQTPIDTDALWDKLQQKRRKPLLFWWWMSAAGLSVSAVLLWVSVQGIKSPGALEPASPTPAEMVQNAPGRPVQAPSLPGAKPTAVQENQAVPSPAAATSKLLAETREVDVAANGSANRGANSTNSKGMVQAAQVQDKPVVQELPSLTSPGLLPAKMNETAVAVSGLNSGAEPQSPAAAVPQNTSTAPIDPVTTQAVPVEMPVVETPAPVAEKTAPKAELPAPELATSPTINTKTSSNAPRMGVHMGYDRWQPTGQIPAHQTNSRSLESISLALEWSRPIDKNWSFQTGLAFARTTRRISHENTSKTFKAKATTNYFVNGSTTIDSIYTEVERTRRIRHYNHWNQIGIPLSLTYRLATGKGALLPQLGLQANWLYAKGVGINKEEERDVKLFENHYQQLFLLQAHAGFDWMFPLGKRCSVSVGPRFQFDLTPRSSRKLSHPEWFWQGGVQVGLSYEL